MVGVDKMSPEAGSQRKVKDSIDTCASDVCSTTADREG